MLLVVFKYTQNKEVADYHTAGIFIPDMACFHCYSLNYESQFNESQWKYAVSSMKIPAVRESATSLLSFSIGCIGHPCLSPDRGWVSKNAYSITVQIALVRDADNVGCNKPVNLNQGSPDSDLSSLIRSAFIFFAFILSFW